MSSPDWACGAWVRGAVGWVPVGLTCTRSVGRLGSGATCSAHLVDRQHDRQQAEGAIGHQVTRSPGRSGRRYRVSDTRHGLKHTRAHRPRSRHSQAAALPGIQWQDRQPGTPDHLVRPNGERARHGHRLSGGERALVSSACSNGTRRAGGEAIGPTFPSHNRSQFQGIRR